MQISYVIFVFFVWISRWSAIAARLPGRTDNEIKNVWHTHLKKKLKNDQSSQDSKSHPIVSIPKCDSKVLENSNLDKNVVTSPQQCSSEMSSVTDSSLEKTVVKNEEMDYSSEYFPQIDESFWSEELSREDADRQTADEKIQFQFPGVEGAEKDSRIDDSMDFWYNLFIRAGDMPDLPEF